jgi:hypothetical protein
MEVLFTLLAERGDAAWPSRPTWFSRNGNRQHTDNLVRIWIAAACPNYLTALAMAGRPRCACALSQTLGGFELKEIASRSDARTADERRIRATHASADSPKSEPVRTVKQIRAAHQKHGGALYQPMHHPHRRL